MPVTNFLIVLVLAVAGTGASKLVNKTINQKNEVDIERHKDRVREITELSQDAIDMGDEKMYHILQKQGNEVYHLLYTAIFLSAIYEVTPHILALALIYTLVPGISLSLGFMTLGPLGIYILSTIIIYASFKISVVTLPR